MGIRYDEDTGQYIRYSEDEPPEVVYRDTDGENWLTQAQYDQVLAQEAAAASAAAEAEAARIAPFTSVFSKPVVSYQGQNAPAFVPQSVFDMYGDQIRVDDEGYYLSRDEEGNYRRSRDDEGNFVKAADIYGTLPQDFEPINYENAVQRYSQGYVPWNWQNIYEGLSSRQPFNLNALWGGTQYAAGRVTDYSHIDPSQYEANLIASNARNELWNVYDQLKSQGKAPEKNPDQLALDFYVKNVGPQGHTFGYGPGANTVLVTEALKNQFLNQPSVVAATGSTYQTPPETLQYSQQFGAARQAGVPTWQVFEQQGYSRDWLGSLMPMIIGSMAFPGLAAGLGGGALGAAGAGALIGGVTSEIGGGDFLKGALTGALGGGLTSGLSGVSSYLQSAEGLGLSKAVADAVVSAGARAITAGATGGDVEQAILSSLVGSGVSGVAGEYLPPDIAKVVAPVVTTALLGGDLESALLKGGLSYLKDAPWGVNPRETQDAGEMIGDESPFALDDAEIGAGVDLTSGTEMPIKTDFDFIAPTSPYEGLEGYTPEVIKQLEQGTYAGSEQTEAEVREQMGDLYDVAYPGWTSGYDLPSGGTTGTAGGTSSTGGAGGTGGTSSTGGAGGTGGSTAPAGGTDYGRMFQNIQNIFNPKEPNYPSPIKPFLAPTMLGSAPERVSEPIPDYSKIIGALASLSGRGMRSGGSVHVPGPEGRFYEKHAVRGFAVGGPGTGQSDDIPTMLSDGEYVFDADTVAALGDGSSKAGAELLDKFREEVRRHKRSAPADRIPPKAKNPLAYLKAAQRAKG